MAPIRCPGETSIGMLPADLNPMFVRTDRRPGGNAAALVLKNCGARADSGPVWRPAGGPGLAVRTMEKTA